MIIQAEVIFLGQLRHPHLVKLIGYCCEDEHRLLVYEYIARGNLENQLFKSTIYALSFSFLLSLFRNFKFLIACLREREREKTLMFANHYWDEALKNSSHQNRGNHFLLLSFILLLSFVY